MYELQHQDGFEIARRDLQIRGPGEILGERQSGAAMLRFANLETDEELLEWARQYAPQMLQKDPALAAKHIERWMGGKIDFLNDTALIRIYYFANDQAFSDYNNQ